ESGDGHDAPSDGVPIMLAVDPGRASHGVRSGRDGCTGGCTSESDERGMGTPTRTASEETGQSAGAVRPELVPRQKVRAPAGDARLRRRPGATREELLERLREDGIHFLRLQFTDVTGVIKNVEVPRSQFEKALDGDIMF